MDYLQQVLVNFEIHSVECIRDCFENGVDLNDEVNNQTEF